MNRGTRNLLLVAVLAAAAGGLASWWRGPGLVAGTEAGQRALQTVLAATAKPPPAGLVVVRRGEPVPNLVLPTVDGRGMALPTTWRGRPVLINWWASWCRPCLEEMPELQRFSLQQGINGVQVVGIALDDAAAAGAMARRLGITYPVLVEAAGPADSSVRLGNPAGVLPYSVLLDAQGRLVKQRVGPLRAGEVDRWASVAPVPD